MKQMKMNVKNMAIIITFIISLTAIVLAITNAVITNNQNIKLKTEIRVYKNNIDNLKSEIFLLRSSVPVDIRFMAKVSTTALAIKKVKPKIDFIQAEYFAAQIVKESLKYDLIDANMLVALIRAESNFNKTAKSWCHAKGLGQIMDDTGRWIIEDNWNLPYNDSTLYNPIINIKVTAWYLNYLLVKNKRFDIALANYNGGFWQAKRYSLLLAQKAGQDLTNEELVQITRLPKETAEYVPKVLEFYRLTEDLNIKKDI